MSIVSAIILLLCILLPHFSTQLNVERTYHITLSFLAPFCILGGDIVFKWISKLFKFASFRFHLSGTGACPAWLSEQCRSSSDVSSVSTLADQLRMTQESAQIGQLSDMIRFVQRQKANSSENCLVAGWKLYRRLVIGRARRRIQHTSGT